MDELLNYAKETDEKILISHHDFPEDLWILGTDQMCHDLNRFCTSELLSYPLTVDPTFSFGKYDVTPFCYRHLFLKSKRTQVPPVFLGPTALHHSKAKATYKKIVEINVIVSLPKDKETNYNLRKASVKRPAVNTERLKNTFVNRLVFKYSI